MDQLLQSLQGLDKRRGKDPMVGRKADEAMVALCTFVKENRKGLSAAGVERALKALKAMNLRPYWNYCREHMLDVGLEF